MAAAARAPAALGSVPASHEPWAATTTRARTSRPPSPDRFRHCRAARGTPGSTSALTPRPTRACRDVHPGPRARPRQGRGGIEVFAAEPGPGPSLRWARSGSGQVRGKHRRAGKQADAGRTGGPAVSRKNVPMPRWSSSGRFGSPTGIRPQTLRRGRPYRCSSSTTDQPARGQQEPRVVAPAGPPTRSPGHHGRDSWTPCWL